MTVNYICFIHSFGCTIAQQKPIQLIQIKSWASLNISLLRAEHKLRERTKLDIVWLAMCLKVNYSIEFVYTMEKSGYSSKSMQFMSKNINNLLRNEIPVMCAVCYACHVI